MGDALGAWWEGQAVVGGVSRALRWSDVGGSGTHVEERQVLEGRDAEDSHGAEGRRMVGDGIAGSTCEGHRERERRERRAAGGAPALPRSSCLTLKVSLTKPKSLASCSGITCFTATIRPARMP